MKLSFIVFFFFFSVMLFSQKTNISGRISGFKDGTEVFLGDLEIGDVIQKSKIKNNKFTFQNPSTYESKKLYLDIKEDTTYYSMFFYIDNKSVTISGDKKDFPEKILVSGSKSYDENKLFEKGYEKLQNKWDSINNLIGEKSNDSLKYKKEEIDFDRLNRSNIDRQIDIFKISYIKSQPNTYRSVMELFYLKDKIGKEEVGKLYTLLDDKLKQTDDGKAIKVYLELEKVLQEGDYFEDFQAKDSNGIPHKLSDYKGKYILLDFIQTYCYACILSNDDLKKIDDKYKDVVQIVTFCGDKTEKTWKEGYMEHKIKWVSLWNGEGIGGRISQLYGTDGTPTFILINPDGKIIKKEFGYSEGKLDAILQELINKK
ncbi:MAG: AhpC/TSA family protein [Flavobacteriaceae bacterium]|nr:AhpC/TSA family protein [Flavobacteriaceae bacterium]